MTDLFRPIIGIENRTAQEVFDIMCDRFSAPIGQRDRLLAALTPDGGTKAAYMGEIKDADFKNRPVSWTAIKAVMALIRKEAGCE